MVAGGPWQRLGSEMFSGLELEEEGTFQGDPCADHGRAARVDWRGRFAHFRWAAPSFRAPFAGPEIHCVEQADEIAYCRCRLRADILARRLDVGIYLEVEVFTNPDNVSLAVVDFEAGGCSSVTFSPDTGAVIRERKVREVPRKVEGAYIQPLTTITAGQGFEGCMGVYLGAGNLAFFRSYVCILPAHHYWEKILELFPSIEHANLSKQGHLGVTEKPENVASGDTTEAMLTIRHGVLGRPQALSQICLGLKVLALRRAWPSETKAVIGYEWFVWATHRRYQHPRTLQRIRKGIGAVLALSG
eukprot:symbB.v1.2.031686.t1/scaffold3704.1/size51685/1